jgi:uncharacterized protein (TIGR00730 family)
MRKNICVFCGSRSGNNPIWSTWASSFGGYLATKQYGLVFGGGAGGLMGSLAQGSIHAGGKVIGVIPNQLIQQEGLVKELSEVHLVDSLSERKNLMDQLSDIYVVLPGGIGTLDEFSEVWTNAQIGYHEKPIILVNWSGYYDKLIDFFDNCSQNGMMTNKHFSKVHTVHTLEELEQYLESIDQTIGANIAT